MKATWYLDGFLDGESHPRRIGVYTSPFKIGRVTGTDVHCVLPCKSLSGVHAELRWTDEALWIRDSNSRNGTFVNRKRINAPTRVRDGDVIHFAKSEFVVLHLVQSKSVEDDESERTQLNAVSVTQLPRRTVGGTAIFRELLSTRAVAAVYQPIVTRAAKEVTDFEILGRGSHPGLPTAPYELFRIAAALDHEVQLSRLFEEVGFCDSATLPPRAGIFLNLHPKELEAEHLDKLLEFLAAQRAARPEQKITVEIHESAVLVRSQMLRLTARLRSLEIDLAYDDFGAGQARLLELIEVPCKYLKFDRSMISDIDKAASQRHKLLETLVRMASELGILCLAEGIETFEEWRVCCQMGFAQGQGFYFGKPAPVSHWSANRLDDVVRLLNGELVPLVS